MRIQQQQLKAQTKGIQLDNINKGLEAMASGLIQGGANEILNAFGLSDNKQNRKFVEDLLKDIRKLTTPDYSAQSARRSEKAVKKALKKKPRKHSDTWYDTNIPKDHARPFPRHWQTHLEK